MTDQPETPPKGKPRWLSKAGEADPEQSRRFIETARELGCDENLDRFDEAVKRIGRARRLPQGGKRAGKENKPK